MGLLKADHTPSDLFKGCLSQNFHGPFLNSLIRICLPENLSISTQDKVISLITDLISMVNVNVIPTE